ncbi:MAG: DUF937 domain-containing protein [Bacteroidales bacterium]|nr:DUF937 domain-containing protein [Bacteroidales bacterium]
MENILGSILSQIDNNALKTISRQANTTPAKAKSALTSAIPALMHAMAKNSSTKEGADALQKAVKKDHDGSLLDNLGEFLNNPGSVNGEGILKHVLGNKRQNVENYISKGAGLDNSSTAKILEMAAPIVMGYLGKKNAGGGGIGDLLDSYLKTEKKHTQKSQSVLNQILDRDGDGDVIDDIAEIGTSFLGRMLRRK